MYAHDSYTENIYIYNSNWNLTKIPHKNTNREWESSIHGAGKIKYWYVAGGNTHDI